MYSGDVTVLGIRAKVYDVLKKSMECESKDRWMRMENWDYRLIRLVSES